jgi:hypothetical protein
VADAERLDEQGVDSARAQRQCHSMSGLALVVEIVTVIGLWLAFGDRPGANERAPRAGRWVLPLDPACPGVVQFMGSREDRAGVIWGLFRDLLDDFERFHREGCRRCRRFGVENGTR